jgi:hypothetical protein
LDSWNPLAQRQPSVRARAVSIIVGLVFFLILGRPEHPVMSIRQVVGRALSVIGFHKPCMALGTM